MNSNPSGAFSFFFCFFLFFTLNTKSEFLKQINGEVLFCFRHVLVICMAKFTSRYKTVLHMHISLDIDISLYSDATILTNKHGGWGAGMR